MKRLKLLKDCLTNKSYGENKANAEARFNHKSGKRNYGSDTWKSLCVLGAKVAE